MKITEFQGKYRWLSNFWVIPGGIEYHGILYPTVEHAYQAQKFSSNNIKQQIAAMATPGEAKRFGRKNVQTEMLVDVERLRVMAGLTWLKYIEPSLRELLLKTYPVILEEGNTWRDTFWGISPPNSGIGSNNLGKIIMECRAEIKSIPKGGDI